MDDRERALEPWDRVLPPDRYRAILEAFRNGKIAGRGWDDADLPCDPVTYLGLYAGYQFGDATSEQIDYWQDSAAAEDPRLEALNKGLQVTLAETGAYRLARYFGDGQGLVSVQTGQEVPGTGTSPEVGPTGTLVLDPVVKPGD